MRKALAILSLSTLGLVAFGLVVLAGASSSRSLSETHWRTASFYLERQFVWLGISFAMALAARYFDYRKWRSVKLLAPALFAGVAFLLALAVAPKLHPSLEAAMRSFARPINGSYRWLDFGPIRLQPGELAKLAAVICLSVWLDRIGNKVQSFVKGAVYPVVILVVLVSLLVAEPDFGSTMVVCVLGFALMFYGGVRLFHILGLGASLGAAVSALVMLNDNRRRRLLAWLEGNDSGAEGMASRSVYQLAQSQRAISNGGIYGVGFGESMQQRAYLPEAHTDFIFAIGAEEWGLAFSIGTILLFALWVGAGAYISAKASDRFGRLLAFGMTYLVGFQAVFNISVVCGTVPTKGLALPFMSYGGTNLMTAMIATAIVFNVGARSLKESGNPARAAGMTKI